MVYGDFRISRDDTPCPGTILLHWDAGAPLGYPDTKYIDIQYIYINIRIPKYFK